MQVIGYCIHGDKQYVAFGKEGGITDRFKITDGFHDRMVNGKDVGRHKGFRWADRQEIDLDRIISHMRGARPWHPLLVVLGKERG